MKERVGYRDLIIELWAIVLGAFLAMVWVARYEDGPFILPIVCPLLFPGVPLVLLTRRYWNAP